MGRLIDADALIKEYPQASGLKLVIENAPTAYDVEKVVAELEERAEEHRKLAFSMDSKNFCNIADRLYGKQVECLEIIDIVRKGGVNAI